MLYVIHGTDTVRVRREADMLLAKLRTDMEGAPHYTLEPHELATALHLAGAVGLFESGHSVLLQGSGERAETRALLIEALPALAASAYPFVLLERLVDAELKRALVPHAASIEEYKQKEERPTFTVFAVSDALFLRNKRALWVAYVRALRGGLAAEAVHGTLFWAVKSMLLAERSRDAGSAGLSPYAYEKAKRGTALFSRSELIGLSRDLVRLYHDAHRGKGELAVGIERWLLRL